MNTTKAALLTPSASAGIAAIELIGRDYQAILKKIFRSYKKTHDTSQPDNNLILGTIVDGPDTIDQVIVAVNPREKSAQINCHGGPRVVQRILMLLQKHGAQITNADQLKPVLSIVDEITLTLPGAKTKMTALTLAAQYPNGLNGWVHEKINSLQKNPDKLPDLQNQAEKLAHTFDLAEKLLNPPSVVITGPANVGKSTLANAITGQNQSLVDELAGTTRDWTIQLIDIQGIPVQLIDTPGTRPTDDLLEQTAINHTKTQIEKADLLILVVQADGNEEKQICQQTAQLPSSENIIIAVNKSDQIDPSQQTADLLYISALTGSNLDTLKKTVADRLGFTDFNPTAPLVFTQRQCQLVNNVTTAHTADHVLAALKNILGNSHYPN